MRVHRRLFGGAEAGRVADVGWVVGKGIGLPVFSATLSRRSNKLGSSANGLYNFSCGWPSASRQRSNPPPHPIGSGLCAGASAPCCTNRSSRPFGIFPVLPLTNTVPTCTSFFHSFSVKVPSSLMKHSAQSTILPSLIHSCSFG